MKIWELETNGATLVCYLSFAVLSSTGDISDSQISEVIDSNSAISHTVR